MNILTFSTRLNMETYRRKQAHRWVQDELFDKVQDKRILVSSNLRWIHSSRMIFVTPVQNAGGWCFASRGVTTEDLRVGHGTTWWTTFIWTKALPRVKWVTTFKVECRILGYVDDLTLWTHGRSNDGRVQVMIGIQYPNHKPRVSYLPSRSTR